MISRQIINHGGEAYVLKYKRVLTNSTDAQLDALKEFYAANTVMKTGQEEYLFLERIPEAEQVEE
jgi:hypothetical protein